VGIDEAGRGPLAGPVVAAAVAVLPGAGPAHAGGVPVAGVRDSKEVPEAEREALFAALTAHPRVVCGVSVVSRAVIDEVNILQATLRGMEDAFAQVRGKLAAQGAGAARARASAGACASVYALVDGPKVPAGIVAAVEARGGAGAGAPPVQFAEPVIGGDAKVYSIAAASLIAKVTRDRIMRDLDARFPVYGFAGHKGYGVASHVAAIFKHGPCEEHRVTFNPVKSLLAAAEGAGAAAAAAPAKPRGEPAAAPPSSRGGKRVRASAPAPAPAPAAAAAPGKRARR